MVVSDSLGSTVEASAKPKKKKVMKGLGWLFFQWVAAADMVKMEAK